MKLASEYKPAFGVDVLTWADGFGYLVAQWDGSWCPSGNLSAYDADTMVEPTHWDELPAEPKE